VAKKGYRGHFFSRPRWVFFEGFFGISPKTHSLVGKLGKKAKKPQKWHPKIPDPPPFPAREWGFLPFLPHGPQGGVKNPILLRENWEIRFQPHGTPPQISAPGVPPQAAPGTPPGYPPRLPPPRLPPRLPPPGYPPPGYPPQATPPRLPPPRPAPPTCMLWYMGP
jgi:hypothetical protein